LIRSLRKERYDFAVDLMDNPSATSTILCFLANAKWNVGIEKDNSYAYDILVPMLSRSDTHIINRIAQLLRPFGINPEDEKLSIRYFLSQDSIEFAGEFLKREGLQKQSLIAVNISAGSKVRFWGIDNFQRLLNYIAKEYPEFRPMLLYKPNDIHNARQIIKSCPRAVLGPFTSTLDQFAALIKRTSILITPDTSAVHLASAFRIRTLVLYVQSDKSLRIWEPYNTDYEAVITDIDDLTKIEFKDVQKGLDKLIKRHKSKILTKG
jgi:ADP-heptose:LPS heptosyltransferase